MKLFKPVWMKNNIPKALKYVENENDQSILYTIVLNSPHANVGFAALAKINDEEKLRYIALNTGPDLSMEAVKKISNQTILSTIAINTLYANIKNYSISKIQDESMLVDIAKYVKSIEEFQSIFSRLTDEDLIVSALLNYFSTFGDIDFLKSKINHLSPEFTTNLLLEIMASTATEIVTEIHDQKTLTMLFKKASLNYHSSNYYELRKYCIENIDDLDLLNEIVDDLSIYDFYRKTAVERIEDADRLSYLAYYGDSPIIRIAAIETIKDPILLFNILKNDPDELFRIEAFKKGGNYILNNEQLVELALINENNELAPLVLAKITSVSHLKDLLSKVSDEDIKSIIEDRLIGFVCTNCGHDNSIESDRTEICICYNCGTENHSIVSKTNHTQEKDYIQGSSWKECTCCGKYFNFETVFKYTDW